MVFVQHAYSKRKKTGKCYWETAQIPTGWLPMNMRMLLCTCVYTIHIAILFCASYPNVHFLNATRVSAVINTEYSYRCQIYTLHSVIYSNTCVALHAYYDYSA